MFVDIRALPTSDTGVFDQCLKSLLCGREVACVGFIGFQGGSIRLDLRLCGNRLQIAPSVIAEERKDHKKQRDELNGIGYQPAHVIKTAGSLKKSSRRLPTFCCGENASSVLRDTQDVAVGILEPGDLRASR